ncbi:MAG: ribbon-helix-helix protein, CopG family [Rhodospirillales bacterium]|nr:ribbon-helix-helix protein, CopG family [Rhodospirillales bacterium]
MAKTALVTARVDPAVKKKLQALAESTQRSESFLAKEAIEAYVEANNWQVALIKDRLAEAMADAKAGKRGIPVSEMEAWASTLARKRPARNG